MLKRIAIIGFGEVGGIFGKDFAKQGIEVSVFDTLLDSKRHRQPMLAKARSCRVRAEDTLSDCLREAEVVISAVTASSALDVAREAGPLLGRAQIFLDINSVSPETKRRAASHVERNQAHFVEAAVMEAVPQQRLKVPMLLGGSHAAEAGERLRSLGMNATAFSDHIGVASAVKMCRSVMIKGLEALAVECLFAARQYGAEDAVLESLAATYPSLGWKDHLPDYLISRVAEHGRRRAAEMREVAQALNDVGVEPTMALATAQRQESLVGAMAERKIRFEATKPFSWRSLADAVVRGARRRSSRNDKGLSDDSLVSPAIADRRGLRQRGRVQNP
jgi:3-hydroxyisobutyrate dehydrogenase-like beta-hydroxyacid dehydrogenase